MGENQALTQEQVRQQLQRIFSDILAVQQQMDADTLLPTVQPGSSLYGDDAMADPYQLSHGVRQGIGVAVDHLHALAVLVGQNQTLHASSPFTLARGAIESGATAYWLLAPKTRTERIARRLRHVAQDARDGDAAAKGMGLEMPRPLDERIADLQAHADAIAGRPTTLRALKYTDLIRTVDEVADVPIGLLAAWRMCSGFAHGRLWAHLSVLHQDAYREDGPGLATVRLTNSPDRVLWAAWAAHDLLRRTLALYQQRARSPY